MSKESKQFEKDVWNFVKALDNSAKVEFDKKITDKDTGTLRQVDAWISTTLGGHIPLTVLVSCKKHKRKLNIGHIDTFFGEVQATSASTGIIYSSAGFTKNALKKAKSHGLSCCRLYKDEPAELPISLTFWSYVCRPRIKLTLLEPSGEARQKNGIIFWKDLLDINVENNKTLSQIIEEGFHKYEKQAITEHNPKDSVFPSDWQTTYTFTPHKNDHLKFKLIVFGIWAIFRGRLECHLLQGSYCYSNDSYYGAIKAPLIDTWRSDPGPGWEEIDRNSDIIHSNQIVAIFTGAKVKEVLEQHLANQKIPS